MSAYVFGVVAVVLITVGIVIVGKPASATPPLPVPPGSVPGSYNGFAPSRVLNTQVGVGAPIGAVAPGGQIAVAVLGRGGVPNSNVSAVALTITAVAATAVGSVTAWPDDGTAKPTTSTLSFVANVTSSNFTVTRVGPGGNIRLSNNSSGTVQLLGDVMGYYVGGTPTQPGSTVATGPARLFDTRSGLGVPKAAIAAGKTLTVPVSGHAGVPSSGASAVLITITAVSPKQPGRLTVYGAGQAQPGTTNISLTAGRNLADFVTAPLGTGGAITILNGTSASLQVVGDVTGYVLGGSRTAGGTMSTVAPTRSVDTRSGLGARKGVVASGATLAVGLTGRTLVPSTNVAAVAMTVTAVHPTAAGSISTWDDGYPRPGTRSVSYVASQNTSVFVIAAVGPDGKVDFYNKGGSTDLIVDVLGYVRADKMPIVASTSRYVRNLTGASSDVSTMDAEGCADAQQAPTGAQNLLLLDIGSQVLTDSVELTATTIVLTNAQLVTALKGYVDGFVRCRTGTDLTYLALGTNNDGTRLDGAGGADWAGHVVDPVQTYAAGRAGLTVAGANDIEPDFDTDDPGTVAEAKAEAWTTGFLGATTAPYVFNGAANGCPTSSTAGTCNRGWTQRNLYDLAHGLSPSRILALPQIYYPVNAQQWKYVSLAGASGADRITFVGALSEYAACQLPGSGCDMDGLLQPAQSWQALRDALSSNSAINLQRLPVSTDLRTDTAPGAPLSANRVPTAGVR
jgi:hypothetical protein